MAPTSARVVLTYLAVVAAGAGLFFLIFGAIFNGLWSLLAIFLLCYLGVGAAAVRIGGVRPMPAALLAVLPALPWVTWLFPASIPEAGLLRASLWPALVLLMGGLAWMGGRVARRPSGLS
ncbi:MAG TPA: hypothetical protein VM387_05635 [Gemmatimonadales bacterium]|nr:hypothetical protein [Gemmatimonadales bacterium]